MSLPPYAVYNHDIVNPVPKPWKISETQIDDIINHISNDLWFGHDRTPADQSILATRSGIRRQLTELPYGTGVVYAMCNQTSPWQLGLPVEVKQYLIADCILVKQLS